ncbi:MAG: hypothetical protein MUF04_02730 [Akkermansiaceae bacterium]|nr:hypothetical protein [Akkermansiaceae bacterium]
MCFRSSIRTLVTLGLASLGLATSSSAAAPYRPPDLKKEIFVTKNISLDKLDRASLVSGLISVARDFDDKKDVDYEARAYALAIAHRLDKKNDRVQTVLDQLKQDGKTIKEPTDKERVSRRLANGVKYLRKKDNKDNLICAAYVCDIALRFDPDGERASEIKEAQKELTDAGHKADWDGILGSPIRHRPDGGGGIFDFLNREEEQFEKKEVRMPGGTAKTFARNQSSIVGLVVRQLDGGKLAGSASGVNATALADKNLKDELLFTFNQDVGPMMGGCLEEVIKFLRVRYEPTPEKIPSGYRIELGFQDKYVPKDGPSAATLFTLVLDSLFSGEEIDLDFACTGDITADGMVQKIGGAAGKIRGATKRGCKIVGIPEPNAKEVADVLLMDGPEQLWNIQIFTMKNFAEAHAISRKTKTSEVQETLDKFNTIAKVLKDKGKDAIKHPETQKRLQEVLDRMPNHLSAKLLLEYSKGTHPKVLSLGGSFNEITSNITTPLRQVGMITRGQKEDAPVEISDIQKNDAKEAVAELDKISKFLDPKLKDFVAAAKETVEIYAKGPKSDEKPADFRKRLNEGLEKVIAVQQKLTKDPKIMEELED